MSRPLVLLVNPRAGSGRAARVLPAIEAALRARDVPFRTVLTRARRDATVLTREALAAGAPGVAVVGGDGTLSEAAGGFFSEAGEALTPGAYLAPLSAGTGGDFRKSIGSRNLGGASDRVADLVDRMLAATPRPIDAGWVEHLDGEGRPARRAFLNIASFGMGGLVDQLVEEGPKWIGGAGAFFVAGLRALARYRPQGIQLRLDDGAPRQTQVHNLMIANGQYFGGGMHAAPRAVLDDGLFDVVGMEHMSHLDALRAGPALYDGRLLERPGVTFARARRVHAEPVVPSDQVLLDVDGEAPGRLPATFEVRAAALHLRA
jgi:diacylglycerol kinase family enzyme